MDIGLKSTPKANSRGRNCPYPYKQTVSPFPNRCRTPTHNDTNDKELVLGWSVCMELVNYLERVAVLEEKVVLEERTLTWYQGSTLIRILPSLMEYQFCRRNFWYSWPVLLYWTIHWICPNIFPIQFSLFGSILTFGAMIGAITSGPIADYIGRKGVSWRKFLNQYPP